jgi:XRE family aerobic/anaerobic benzoate catabolism transcriptional regulator
VNERTGKIVQEEGSPALLGLLATRVRARRGEKGWTQEELARVSGVSVRYVASLERGDANMSILRLAEVAQALGVSLTTLVAGGGPVHDDTDRLASLVGEARRRALREVSAPALVALVGLRGAGKTAVGARLAELLAVPFRELDAVIEAAAGVRLGEIFEYHGPARYRDLERQALDALLAARGGMVLATGGSVVTAPESWEVLRRGARTVWLQASPESHLGRVEAQGDFRPMRGREDALAELKGILAARAPLYAQAELHVDTEAMGPDAAAARIVAWVRGE